MKILSVIALEKQIINLRKQESEIVKPFNNFLRLPGYNTTEKDVEDKLSLQYTFDVIKHIKDKDNYKF